MQVNVAKFLEEAGIEEQLYPGKKIVKACKQTGEYKSHCVVLDWRDPSTIRIELKAGLTGKTLAVENLKKYPVSFQTPTYIEIDMSGENDNEINAKDDDEDEDGARGKGGSSSGGRKFKKKAEGLASIAARFGESVQGAVPELGKVVEMVVMGMQIGKDAYGAVMEKLANQMKHAKIAATELLAQAGKMITRYQPPSFMAPKGDETATYKYDREKNADIGYRPGMA